MREETATISAGRPTETVILHFDLANVSHFAGARRLTLNAPRGPLLLQRHTPQTRRAHARRNAALGKLSDDRLDRLTHFVEEVTLPTDAISFCWVGIADDDPDAVCDDIAVVFQHVPSQAVRRAVRAMQQDGPLTVPARLRRHGLAAADLGVEELEELHVQASLTIDHRETAKTMVMQHPDFGTLIPATHYLIAEDLIEQLTSFDALWKYLSRNLPNSRNAWYKKNFATDPTTGELFTPVGGLVGEDGEAVEWPTATIDGKEVPAIPQFELSEALEEVLGPVVRELRTAVMKVPRLKGQQWTTQHGVTQVTRTDTAPDQTRRAVDLGAPVAADWTVVNKTSTYGLDLFQDSIAFDEKTQTLKFDVKNWPNRGLGVYVQFVDVDGTPIKCLPPSGLQRWPEDLRKWVQPNDTKGYLGYLSAGNTMFGIPIWAERTPIELGLPNDAVGANVLFGGLGVGNWDLEVDKLGITYTCVVCYGIPSLLMALSVGVTTSTWFREYFVNASNVALMVRASRAIIETLLHMSPEDAGAARTRTILLQMAKFVAAIVFSTTMLTLATKVAGYVAAVQIGMNVPFIGWALRVAGIAAAAADMTATTIEVGLSPATYQLQAKRSMTLKATVTPDPKHGTGTKSAWPHDSDRFVVDVRYKGGTTLTKSGRMPAVMRDKGEPIAVTFSSDTGDALPAAPNQRFQIVASIYSSSNALRGKWVSEWLPALPTDGNVREERGAIEEQLVPLVPSTQYQHAAKLGYDATSTSYDWKSTTAPPEKTVVNLSGQSVRELVDLTINGPAYQLGYCYQAQNQWWPLDYGITPVGTSMYVFKSVSALGRPDDGMLVSKRGFSVQPHLAYDQFGTTTTGEKSPAGGRNFYLDTRTYATTKLAHLRRVTLKDSGSDPFEFNKNQSSWGAFATSRLDGMAVHPNGYVVAIDKATNTLSIVRLPDEGVADAKAEVAQSWGGTGSREGLLDGPVAVTVSGDGRVLVLEHKNARIQAFDSLGNPVRCFTGSLRLSLPAALAAELDGLTTPTRASAALLQTLQRQVPVTKPALKDGDSRLLMSPAFTLPPAMAAVLDAGTVTKGLADGFADYGMALGDGAKILQTSPGVWLLRDVTNGLDYDIRRDGEGLGTLGGVDVYRCFSPMSVVRASGTEWELVDKTNTLSFAVTKQSDGQLLCRQLTALMPLKPVTEAKVTYLDVAVENRGYVYVLSYVDDGAKRTDYRLDVYQPDGTPLNGAKGVHNGIVNAAKMAVDPWRAVYTLNYEQLQGVNDRMEPTLSKWVPSPAADR